MNHLNTEHVIFYNNTYLPIMIETWVYNNPNLTHIVIEPFEKLQLHSCTGEWYINCRFTEDSRKLLWKQFYTNNHSILQSSYYLGKFRNTPCIRGDYSWLENDWFECIYCNGMIEFKELLKNNS